MKKEIKKEQKKELTEEQKKKKIVIAIVFILIVILLILNYHPLTKTESNKRALEGYYKYETSNPAGTYFLRELQIKKNKTIKYVIGEATNEEYSDVKKMIEYTGKYTKTKSPNSVLLKADIKSTNNNCVDGRYQCKMSITIRKYRNNEYILFIEDTTAPMYYKTDKPLLIK